MNAPTLIKNHINALLVLASLGLTATASGALLPQLYVGEADVETASRVDVDAQMRALEEVLRRITGREDLIAEMGLGVADLPRLIQSRQVIERQLIANNLESRSRLRERVEFDAQAIDQRLAEQGIPRWGGERASVLVWAVMEDAFGAEWVDDPLIDEAMREMGRVYGLDLIRPLADAVDLSQLSLADVRGGFVDQLGPGLLRYGASVGLMLDLRPDPMGWLARAFWRIDGVDGGQSFLAETPLAVIEAALQALHRVMARRYAIDLNDQATRIQRIRLIQMQDPVQYAEAIQYLEELGIIESIRLLQARGLELEFELRLRGDNLVDVLAVGQTLEVVDSESSGLLVLRLQ